MYPDFDSTQGDIETLCEIPDDLQRESNERDSFEKCFFSAVASAEEALSKHPLISSGSSSSSNDDIKVTGSGTAIATGGPSIKLPTIHLPVFSGHYQDWLGYHDTYMSLIHNNPSIHNIHKFHYLRASLKENAAMVIHSIDFSSESYDIAWQLLSDRYNNNKILINNHIQALFNIESVTHESATALRHIIDTLNKNLRSLKALNLPTEHWDAIIIHMVSSKLVSSTSRE